MRYTIAGIVVLLFLCAAASPAPKRTFDPGFQDPRIHESLVTTSAGGLVLHLENATAHAVTAFEVFLQQADQNGRPSPEDVRYEDVVPSFGEIGERERREMPGPNAAADYVIVPDQAAGKYPPPKEVALLAVVFDDGSSAGDPTWVSVIVSRRKARLQAIQNVLPMLLTVRAGKESADNVISQLGETVKQQRSNFNATARAAFQARGPASTAHTPESGGIVIPFATAQEFAQEGIYTSTANNLRNAESSGRLADMVNILVRQYTQSVQDLQNSKPALN